MILNEYFDDCLFFEEVDEGNWSANLCRLKAKDIYDFMKPSESCKNCPYFTSKNELMKKIASELKYKKVNEMKLENYEQIDAYNTLNAFFIRGDMSIPISEFVKAVNLFSERFSEDEKMKTFIDWLVEMSSA